jgi:hypothetical protein
MNDILLVFLIYFIAIALAYYVRYYAVDIESFDVIFTANNNPTGECFECIGFYANLLSIPDVTQMPTYIKHQNDLIQTLFDGLDTYLNTRHSLCPNIANIDDYTTCLTQYISNLQCPSGYTALECEIRQTLLTQLISKAILCDGKTQSCKSVDDFESSLISNYSTLKNEFATCKGLLASNGDCLNTYTNAITTRINAANTTSAASANDDKTLVTLSQLKDKIYDTNIFAMTSDYKG